MLCIHYRERALSILASWWQSQWAGHHHHHQPGAGSGEHIALPLVDAVTSAASWWWQRQSRAWWFVIRVKHVEVSQHNAFTYFVARGFHPVGSDQRAYVIRHSVPAAGGRALHQIHPVHSSQQKELKSISSAKVMCSCSWVNKTEEQFQHNCFIFQVVEVDKLSEPSLCCLWDDERQFQFQYQEATRSLGETRRDLRSLKKPRANLSSHEQPQAAPRSLEKVLLGAISGHYEFREGLLTALLTGKERRNPIHSTLAISRTWTMDWFWC